MSLEDKALITAAGPAVGFISAAIAPKVEQVKKWAEKKELKKQLEPEKLAFATASYLERLSKRVSKMSCICFPQAQLDIKSVYEPLFLRDTFQPHIGDIAIEDVIQNLDKSFSIIDSAGMGKSTFSKYLVYRVLESTNYIPILFELRRSKPGVELIESIAKELDLLGAGFSRELFYELLNDGKFIIVLDGFDEVEIDRQQEVAEQIKTISEKGFSNTLVLTSRKQELIPNLLNSIHYQFSDFSIDQSKNLIHRLDEYSGANIGSRLIEEFDSVPPKFLENPLLVSLLYTTFGANNSIADRISTFYREVYDALYKGHDLKNKNGFKREKLSKLDIEQFKTLLRALCFQMVAKRIMIFDSTSDAIEFINRAVKVSNVIPASSSAFLQDLQNSVPLMLKEGHEYKFLHATIVEFFAAEFIVYESKNREVLLDKMFQGSMSTVYSKVFDFVNDISPSLYDKVITQPIALSLLKDREKIDNNYKSILYSLLDFRDFNLLIVPLKKYTENVDSDRSPNSKTLNDNFPDEFELIHMYTWEIFEYKGEEYFFIGLGSEDLDNIPLCVYDKLSVTYDSYEYDKEKCKREMVEIAEKYGVEKWISFNRNLILEFSNYEALIQISKEMFSFNHGNVKIWSLEKVEKFVSALKVQSDFDEEIESLF